MSGAGFCRDFKHYIDAVVCLKAEVDKSEGGYIAGLTLTVAKICYRGSLGQSKPWSKPWRVVVRWSK